jgi:hypothetical protein
MIEEHFVHSWSPIVSSPWKGRNRSCKHTSTVHIDETHENEDGTERFIPGRNWYAANDSEVHYTRDGNFHVISISMPFAHLGKLDDERNSRPLSHSDVPTHTLFQSLNRKGDANRDLKQAVCRMKTGERQDCQLISNLWAVIINDGTITTNAALSDAWCLRLFLNRDYLILRHRTINHLFPSFSGRNIWFAVDNLAVFCGFGQRKGRFSRYPRSGN